MKLYPHQTHRVSFVLILVSFIDFSLPRCDLSVLSMSSPRVGRGPCTLKRLREDRRGPSFLITRASRVAGASPKKEVFQPHLPVRLPCYDLAPITGFALGRSSRSRTSGAPSFHGLTGGVYKARERIHRAMADARLLANPTSRSRVADPNPN